MREWDIVRDERGIESPVTARAVCIGLFVCLLINLAMPYNDHYLWNTLLIGNHFPVIALVFMLFLILGVNALLARVFGVRGLSPGEILLIWAMIGVSGGICSAGVMRYAPTWVVVPTYYNRPENDFGEFILKYLPDWMLLSRNPDDEHVRWFMEGLPRGRTIPWGRWAGPLGVWIAFMLLLYAANYAFIAMFFRQWSVRERLVFPVIQLPLLLVDAPRPGFWLNSFLSNRLTWLGFAIPAFIWGVNGLRSYVPEIPMIPTSYGLWSLFPDRPWSEFNLNDAKLFFTVIGLTFLLTTEVSLSLWFFYVAYRLSFVYVAWLGAGSGGFFGDWTNKITVFEQAGALLVIAGFLFWTARGFLKGWLGRILSGETDRELDPLPPRLSLVLLAGGMLGMTAWIMLAGAQWWVAVIMTVFLLVTILVLTRIVAEAGLIFVHSSTVTYEMVTGIFPAHMLNGFSLTAMAMQRGVLTDLREILMPYVMNGLKAAEAVRMRLGKVLLVFAAAAVISLGTSAFSRITTAYKYGALNMDTWATIWSVDWYLPAAVKYQKTPPAYDMTGLAEIKLLPVNLAHILIGTGLTGGMLLLRAKFLWWPLHPFGLVMCPTWCLMNLWFSFFLGWLAKFCVMTFGGATVFRKLLPFFLGLVLGESVLAAFWILIGLVTGKPGIGVLPA